MTARWSDHLGTGNHAARPAANAVPVGALYACSTHLLIYQSDGAATWSTWATLGTTPAVMVASGASHAAGLAPDPGAVAGTTRFLREDATWVAPAAAGRGVPSGTLLRSYTFATTVEGWLTDTGTLTSTGGKLRLVDATPGSICYEPGTAADVADGELLWDHDVVSGGSGHAAIIRLVDALNFYVVTFDPGSPFVLYKVVAGAYTSLNLGTPNFAQVRVGPSYRMLIRFVGAQIDLFCNEAWQHSWTDTTYTTGRVGFRGYNGTQEMDNVKVYSVP